MMALDLEWHQIAEWPSKGVRMQELLRRDDHACRAHIAQYDHDSLLGRYAGQLWQLFTVISGSGWVAGQDHIKQPCGVGDTFLWSPGERHESGSEQGMIVVIVQSSQPLNGSLQAPS
jgi:hypothetical protein